MNRPLSSPVLLRAFVQLHTEIDKPVSCPSLCNYYIYSSNFDDFVRKSFNFADQYRFIKTTRTSA